MARIGEATLLVGVLGVAGLSEGLAVLRGPSPVVSLLAAAACVTLSATAFLLRREAEQSRHGLLLYAAAGCLVLSDAGAHGAAGAQLGRVTSWWAVLPLAVVLFTYPGRRVVRPWQRWLLVALGVEFVGLWTAAVLVPAVGAHVGGVLTAAGVVLPLLACVALAQRWHAAAAPERPAVRSVAVVGLALASTLVVRYVAGALAHVGPVAAAAGDAARVLNLACLGLAPVGLLLEALRRRAARAAVVEALLRAGGDPGRIREATARALGDPTLRLALPPGGTGVAAPGRVRRELRSAAGTVVAVADVAEAATADAAQLRTVLAATALALDNVRLQADLRRSLAEVRASRERIVAAGVQARRHLERDLHDGAQQRLLAVSAALARAGIVADHGARDRAMGEARTQLSVALDELRRLARGIHPAVLTQGGLAAALPTLGDAAPVPVRFDLPPAPPRLPAAVEATLWFVAAESVTNAVRHSDAASIRVRLRTDGDGTAVAVEDDGRGGASLRAGGGLAGLADRVSALGGTLTVVSPPATGTRVEAVLPCGC